MEAWIGPAIVAAAISGLVSLIVVQLNFSQTRRADALRREEKIRDFQIALRAEIRSELENLNRHDLESMRDETLSNYQQDQTYFVIVPRVPHHHIFDAVIKEIHVLPQAVIVSVVAFSRQRQVATMLADDIRDATFRQLGRDRQVLMYFDYLNVWKKWRDLAAHAVEALDAELA